MLRSRTARLATLALGVITPVIAITASPGFASGESTTAVLTAPGAGSSSQTFTWSYAFDQNGGNALSNVAVGFCSDAILADVVSASPSATIFNSGDVEGGHTGFGPGIKFGVTAVTGVFRVTFGHSHSISSTGLRVQSHSGGGQTGDTPTVAAGPGPCPADEVTTTTSSSSTSSSTSTSTSTSTSSTTSTTIDGNGKANGGPSSGGSTTTTTSTTGDEVRPLVITDDPSPTTTTTAAPAGEIDATTPTTGIPTSVLGETVDKAADPAVAVDPGSLARTGAGHLMFLVTLALGLIAAGTALLSAFRRRNASASTPS